MWSHCNLPRTTSFSTRDRSGAGLFVQKSSCTLLLCYTSPVTKNDIQQRLRSVILQSPYRGNVRRISLFGSYLHGTTTSESDVDLLIELKKPMSMLKLVRMERALADALGKKVDLRTPMSLSKYFRSDVLQEAETIFEAMP